MRQTEGQREGERDLVEAQGMVGQLGQMDDVQSMAQRQRRLDLKLAAGSYQQLALALDSRVPGNVHCSAGLHGHMGVLCGGHGLG